MKREIKFRAWDNVTNDILPNVQSHRNDEIFAFANMLVNTERFTFMQYTGLKDKNGVEIYEGDIVKVTQEDFIGVPYELINKIIWGTKGGWHPEGTFCDNLQEYITNIHGKNVSEVIGNIYENPELLNQ